MFREYDQHVQTQTTISSGEGDAAVLAPRGTHKGIALAIDGNSRQTYLNPYIGGQLAVVEAARNVACSGAKPQAVTDGLNFGSPQDPHVYWQFNHAVRGIADAAEALGTPVISGNVSFYNESELGEVPPTPIIGMLGILENADRRIGIAPHYPAELWVISIPGVKVDNGGLGASAALFHLAGLEDGYPVAPDLAGEMSLSDLLVDLVDSGTILSAHDVSDGGIGVTLAEMCFESGLGAQVDLDGDAFGYSDRTDARAFGELPGMVVVSVSGQAETALVERARNVGLMTQQIGWIRESEKLTVNCAGNEFSWRVDELKRSYEGAIESAVAGVL